jgi:NDP-sugar pyrophosphorylase family protein
MKAMILAAGLGERMRPLTESRAKPSLPLLNRPIIAQTLSYLKAHGVDEAVINLHWQPESIRGVIGNGQRLGVKVHYSEEQLILGTAGGLKKAESHFQGGGTFILMNGDFVTDCDLSAVIAEHKRSGAVATMVLTPHRPGTDYGSVEVDPASGHVVSIAGLGRKPGPRVAEVESYTFCGIHILEQTILDLIPPGVKYEINREVYPALMQSGGLVKGYVHRGHWFEMGTPRLYLEGNLALLSAASDSAKAAGADAALQAMKKSDGVFLENVSLPASTTAAAPYLIGKAMAMGEHCSMQGGVIIGRQVRIGSNCAIRSSLIWDGARLGDKVHLTDSIVTSGVFVPPGSSLSGRILFRVEGYQGKRDNLERVGSAWAARIG